MAVIRQRLERQRDAAQPKAGGVRQRRQLQRVVRGLEAFAGRVERWPADAVTRGVLHRGLKRIYRQGRDTMREAYAAGEPDAERFHDWRKRVKDLWYLARVLGDARPRKHKRLVADLKKLADLLGEHHDLAVLRERLGSPPKGAGAAVTRVTEAADARQAKVVRAAKPIGARVYREKPGRFTDRLVPSA